MNACTQRGPESTADVVKLATAAIALAVMIVASHAALAPLGLGVPVDRTPRDRQVTQLALDVAASYAGAPEAAHAPPPF